MAVTALLVAVIVGVSAVTLAQGPRTSSVEMISRTGSQAEVNDYYDGNTTIPYYDIALNSYSLDDFVEENSVVEYTGADSYVGVSVNEKKGDIDWVQVKNSGVDFAMIRVGLREKMKGRIKADANFVQNITGATEAGLQVGVYFYSKAATDAEADEEAKYVLEQIREYSVKYPIAFYWEYDLKEDGSQDERSRVVGCNGEQVTGFINTFCGKMKTAGYDTCYYATKTMAYNRLNLSRLTNYDLWYAEYRPKPSFYYDFKMWQYTETGTVPGISQEVPINIALKKYA